MTRRVLVTGATGAVGPALVAQLLAHGDTVQVLARTAPALPPTVSVLRGDILDPGALARAVAGVEIVFHLAAKLHVNDPAPLLQAEYQRVNVEGTRLVAEAARAAGVARLVLFSTINVYGPTPAGTTWNEQTPLQPDTLYARTKAEAEQVARSLLPTVVLRLAAVYGPGMRGNYPRLLNAIRRGRFVQVGDGLNRRTLVHVADVCAAARLVAGHPAALGETFNVTDGEVHTLRTIIAVLSRACGRRPPRLTLPLAPLRLAAWLATALLGRRSPLTPALLGKLTEEVAVDGTKLQGLGFRPQYDLDTGWRATVAALYPQLSASRHE